jgi:chemotaxis protein MotA
MNITAIIGLILSVSAILFGILLGAPISIFIDPASLIIGPVATLILLIATFGFRTVRSAFSAGLRGLFASDKTGGDSERLRMVKLVATSGINYSMLTGFSGGLIGLIQMLTNMSDPTAIGPALAVCLLSAFYAVVMVMLVYYPLLRNAEKGA